MAEPIDVLVYGLGAIGSFYTFILNRADRVRLTVVARSNYDAVVKNRKPRTAHFPSGSRYFPPPPRPIPPPSPSQNPKVPRSNEDEVIRTPSEASDTKFAFVLCTHKAVDPDAAIVPLDPVITEDTTIVVLQNGVGNEDPFRKRYPNQTVISGVVWVGAAQPSPGIITHTTAERTQLGLFPNPSIPSAIEESRLNAFAALLSSGGTHFDICANIQISRWEKVVWNVAWNAITTLTDQDVESWLNSSPNAVRYTRRLMGEVVAVARASGVLLDEGLIDTLMDRVKGLGKLRTSMQADREAGRGMEVEVILGVPVKRGREYGVATPFLESLYVLLTALNRKILEGAR